MPTFFEASASISEEQMGRIAHFEAVAAYCLSAATDPTFQNPEVALRVAERAHQDAARLLLTEVRADQMLVQGSVVRVGYQVQDHADGMTLTTIRAEVADPKHAQGRYARTTIAASARPGGLIDEFAHIAAPDIPGEITVTPLFDPNAGVLAKLGNRIAGVLGITGETTEVRDFTTRKDNVDATRDGVVARTVDQFRNAAVTSAPHPIRGNDVQTEALGRIQQEEEQQEAMRPMLEERVRDEIKE